MKELLAIRDGLVQWYQHHFSTGDLVVFVLILLAGVVAMWLLHHLVGRRVRTWADRRDPVLGERLLAALAAPLRVLIFCWFLVLALKSLDGLSDSVLKGIDKLAPVIYLLCGFLFAFRSMDIVTEVLRRRWAADETTLDERWARLIGGLGKALVGLVFLFVLLSLADETKHIVPLLTGASFVGAAIALASKETIANAIGSFEIMLDRLFKEGDRISFGDYDGFVTKMGLRSIQITSMTGEKIALPNKDLVDKQIRNYSRHRKVRTLFTLGLEYAHTRADVERAMAVLREILDANPRASEPAVSFKGFGASTLDLQVSFWGDYADSAGYNSLLSEINLAIKERFDAGKLSLAFPTSTVHLRSETSEEK